MRRLIILLLFIVACEKEPAKYRVGVLANALGDTVYVLQLE